MNKTWIAALSLTTFAFAQQPGLRWEPLDLEGEYGERLKDAFRTMLDVPLDREQPGGKRIRLAVARLAGKAGGVPLLYLQGGPGGIATSWVTHAMWEPFREIGDVILLDQRGCGRSQPALYLHPSAGLPVDVLESRSSFEDYITSASEEAASALRAQGYEPSAFHNLASVADLEDLRVALGAPKLNLMGHSYGTHLGLVYLRHHPGVIANAVLAGVEGPDMTHKYPQVYDVHWRRLMSVAKADPALVSHASELDDLLPRALGRLEKEPLIVRADDPVTGSAKDFRIGSYGLLLVLAFDLGDNTDIPVLPRLLHEVAKGETRTLAWFVRKRLSVVAGLPITMFTMDGGAGSTAGRALAIREQSEHSPFASIIDLHFPRVEAILEPRVFGDDYRAPLSCNVRTLFVSGMLDVNTPPHQAEEVRWGFRDAAHLVARNAGHEGCCFGNEKSLRAIRDFLAGQDVAHRDIDLPTLRFAPFEGPSAVVHPSLE
jgi:pimeloyl-ACP methyl ester carboxylesterase